MPKNAKTLFVVHFYFSWPAKVKNAKFTTFRVKMLKWQPWQHQYKRGYTAKFRAGKSPLGNVSDQLKCSRVKTQ